MDSCTPAAQFEIPQNTLEKLQNIVDILAELMHIPAALIMRLVDTDIEVLLSSQSDNNPYHPGDHEHFLGSGLYCETVINSNRKLLIPNALKDDKWKNNPDIKLDMISYLGFPIMLPDGSPFGTICVLDKKENAYSKTYESLVMNFRDVVQSQLALIYINHELGEENKKLSDYLAEIKVLRGIVPICSFCKKVRDAEGNWQDVTMYVSKHSETQFSHSYCPECSQVHYGEFI